MECGLHLYTARGVVWSIHNCFQRWGAEFLDTPGCKTLRRAVGVGWRVESQTSERTEKRMFSNKHSLRLASRLGLAIGMILLLSLGMFGQSTVGSGSIVGSVTDPSGAVLSGAKVTITNSATGQTLELTSNSAGAYASGALLPGTYKVQVSSKGFSSVSSTVTVQVGNTSTVNAKMTLGQETTTIEVQGSAVQVNTEQPTVQGVLTANQIENLPVNGRNFLDLAQLEPGVQIQDGQNFDPTKAGYSSISFGGRFGRTARIEVDGVDVSDETVGTTTTDIPASAIQEFQISQSSLDMSSELTSSGAVNVTTKSGTNAIHGEAFGQFRDSSIGAAALPTPPGFTAPYQRSQYGGALGGPIVRDKLFFFADGERTIQHTAVLFRSLLRSRDMPERFGCLPRRRTARQVDYQFGNNAHAFYRYTYFKNSLGATFGYGFSVYDNDDITRNHVVGLDFNTGSFTHSLRFSYLKFQNQIVDATMGNSALPFNNVGAELFMGSPGWWPVPTYSHHRARRRATTRSVMTAAKSGVRMSSGTDCRSITSRAGVSHRSSRTVRRSRRSVSQGEIAAAARWPVPGGDVQSFQLPCRLGLVSNGLGFSTTKQAFGFPAGGLGPDNRILAYLGDTWKIKGTSR